MNYGYIENGKIIAPVAMRSRFNNVGAWHLLTDEQRAVYGWYPCTVVNEGYDGRTQTRSDTPVCVFDEVAKVITATYTIAEKDPKLVKQQDGQVIATYRYEREVGNILWNGFTIYTDRESQMKLKIEKDAAAEGLRTDGSGWKCLSPSGELVFRPTTNAEMVEIANAAYLYVKACFDREEELLNLVAAGEYDSTQLQAGWPARNTTP